MKDTRSRIRRLELTLVAALGVVAILALPAIASAKARDRNHDGIPDRWEKRHHLSLKVNQAPLNQDKDGLNNLGEFQNGTNPLDADTDNDGLNDGQEIEVGDDPTDNDTDGDGVEDGQENAGQQSSADDQSGDDDPVGEDDSSDEAPDSVQQAS